MSRAPRSIALLALVLCGAAAAIPPSAGARQAESPRLLTTPTEHARTTKLAGARRVAVADRDLDGEVTSEEAAQYYEGRFRLLDGDRDGWIQGHEFLRAVDGHGWPAAGRLSKPRPLGFQALDVDGSGALTPEELLRAVKTRSLSGRDAASRPRQAVFDTADGDRDGALSRREFIDAGAREFDRSDTDGDGKVSIWQFYGGTSL